MAGKRENPEVIVSKPRQVEVLQGQGMTVVDALADLLILRGPLEYIRSDNGPEFIAHKVRDWIAAVGSKAAYIEPGSPWEKGYCESFNARSRDELLNGEIFYSLREAQILIVQWRLHNNTTKRAQRFGLPSTRGGKYCPDGPEAHDALPMKPGDPMGHACDGYSNHHESSRSGYRQKKRQRFARMSRSISGLRHPPRRHRTKGCRTLHQI